MPGEAVPAAFTARLTWFPGESANPTNIVATDLTRQCFRSGHRGGNNPQCDATRKNRGHAPSADHGTRSKCGPILVNLFRRAPTSVSDDVKQPQHREANRPQRKEMGKSESGPEGSNTGKYRPPCYRPSKSHSHTESALTKFR